MRNDPTKKRRPSRPAARPARASNPKPGGASLSGDAPAKNCGTESEFSRAAAGSRQHKTSGKKPAFSKGAGAGTRRDDKGEKRRPKAAARTDLRQDVKARRVPAGEVRTAPASLREPIPALDAKATACGSSPAAPQRIAKVMARAGVCSRRDAEVWIAEGRVALNGAMLTDPAINVGDADEITVDGEPLARRAPTRLFLFHKPRGLVTTERDPEGRPTIFDHLRDFWPEGPRVVSIGRLDINTEGLLLLTNDGGLARLLELPSTGWLRRYRVRAKGVTDQSVLDGLRGGLTIEGVDYAGIEATLDREQGANSWLTIGLREGKNREIKRVLEHIGLLVNRLIRVSFGPFQLGEIVEGAIEEVRTRVLRDQLGPMAAKAGTDFSTPALEDEDAQGSRIALQARPDKRSGPRAPDGAMFRNTSLQKETRASGPDRRWEDARGERPAKGRPRPSPQPERGVSAETRSRPAPGPRKHVSALRAGEGAGQPGGRKRIERAETADRSGRTIHIERLVSAEPQDKRRDKPATRNGRRFEAERNTRDGGPRSPSRGRDRTAEFAAQREGEPTGPPPRRSQNPAYASRTPPREETSPDRINLKAATRQPDRRASATDRSRAVPEAKRGSEGTTPRSAGARQGRARKIRARKEPPLQALRTPNPTSRNFPESRSAIRRARTAETRRGEGHFAPKPEGERTGGRSRPGGPPKRTRLTKEKFGSKDSGGARKHGRSTGPGESNNSSRSKGPGGAAKPGTGRPRDKR